MTQTKPPTEAAQLCPGKLPVPPKVLWGGPLARHFYNSYRSGLGSPKPGQRSASSQRGGRAIWLRQAYAIAVVALVAAPVAAQDTLPVPLTVPSEVQDTTGGVTSLRDLVGSSSDEQGNKCSGFADVRPNYTLKFTKGDNPRTFTVQSNGDDTTLVIQGPEGKLWCGDDSDTSQDAQVIAQFHETGTYKIWVGSWQPGQQVKYTLTVR